MTLCARDADGRQTTLNLQSRGQSMAGPSGSKKTIYSQNIGASLPRPSFEGQRLSPRLNPAVGGSGSKSSHGIVLSDDDSPVRKMPRHT